MLKQILQYMGWRRIAVEALRRDGLVIMPPLAESQVKEILEYIENNKGHLLAMPWWFEVTVSMYDLAKRYLEKDAYLVHMGFEEQYDGGIKTSWFTTSKAKQSIEVVIYLTDVKASGLGAYVFLPGTHVGVAKGNPDTVLGLAGTMFVFDPAILRTHLTSPKRQLLLRSVWSAYPDSHLEENPLSRAPIEVLGLRYPRSPVLQKALSYVFG